MNDSDITGFLRDSIEQYLEQEDAEEEVSQEEDLNTPVLEVREAAEASRSVTGMAYIDSGIEGSSWSHLVSMPTYLDTSSKTVIIGEGQIVYGVSTEGMAERYWEKGYKGAFVMGSMDKPGAYILTDQALTNEQADNLRNMLGINYVSFDLNNPSGDLVV